MAGLLDALKQYITDAMPGGALNPEAQPVATQANYLSGILDPASQVSQDAQAWHKRTQNGLMDQLAGRDTPEAEQAYQTMMQAAGMVPVGIIKYGKGFDQRALSDLISSQRFFDRKIVADKIRNQDFTVRTTPPFEVDGEMVRAVTDGHHALEAAKRSRNQPVFITDTPITNDRISLLKNPKDYLDAAYHDSPWYRISNGVDIW